MKNLSKITFLLLTIVLFSCKEKDYKYKIEGNKEVLMTDFGVKPPTAIMGLLKARDRLTFYYDIIVNG